MKPTFSFFGGIPCNLTASYILSVFSDLKTYRHHFYEMLMNAHDDMICIHLVYDFRFGKGWDKTIYPVPCGFSPREFVDCADTFHDDYRFVIYIDGDDVVQTCESDFNVETVRHLCTDYLRQRCRLLLHRNLSFSFPIDITMPTADVAAINELVEEINTEITGDLQLQYDVLKNLKCIHK